MHRLSRTSSLALIFAGSLFLATACSGAESTGGTGSTGNPEGLKIVASTAIWGDVASAVVDPATVEVTAIVEGNDADPHSFEPSATDMARAAEADIIVVGGGGYDSWLYDAFEGEEQDKIIHALPLSSHDHSDDHSDDHGDDHDHEHDEESQVAEAHDHEGEDHDAEGHSHAAEGFLGIEDNEHIWYDTTAVSQVAEEIADRVRELNPEATADATELTADLDQLHNRLAELPAIRVAQTEPIADHLLAHSDATEVTPANYRASTLGHSEPTAADLAEFLELIEAKELDLLIYNPQTSTDLSSRIRQAAEDAGIPVVEIFETPEAGENFLEFFHGAVDRLEEATGSLSTTGS